MLTYLFVYYFWLKYAGLHLALFIPLNEEQSFAVYVFVFFLDLSTTTSLRIKVVECIKLFKFNYY